MFLCLFFVKSDLPQKQKNARGFCAACMVYIIWLFYFHWNVTMP